VLHENLWRAWSVQKRAVPIIPALYFSPDGLALGAGTILLPAVGPRRLANLQGEEARLLALLSATYGKAISPSVLGNIERAAKSWRDGDDTAAVIHLAHAGLPRPHDADEAARRLFITDAFIKAGASPIGILQALGLEGSYIEIVEKLYNPLEPRVPPGNGIFSGRWTKILSSLGDLTGAQAEQLGLWATRLLGPTAIVAGGAPLFPYSRYHVPWIAYLSAPLASGLQLAAGILAERTPDGGVLMTAMEERLDPTNPEHLRRARIIAETMVTHAGGG
jgi:hypothetical protein